MTQFRVRNAAKDFNEVYVEQEGDQVAIKFVDTDGDDWYIGYVSERGLSLCGGIPDSVGLAVDEDGLVIVDEQE